MFKYVRLLRGEWMAYRALIPAIEADGTVPPDQVISTARRILFIKETHVNELSFREMIGDIYHDRPVRDAVIMLLINVGSFWKCRAALCETPRDRREAAFNLAVATVAATALAQRQWTRETEHASIVRRYIRDNTRDAIFHCGVDIDFRDRELTDALMRQVRAS